MHMSLVLTNRRRRGGSASAVPSNAIRDRAGNPILDRFGAFILTRS